MIAHAQGYSPPLLAHYHDYYAARLQQMNQNPREAANFQATMMGMAAHEMPKDGDQANWDAILKQQQEQHFQQQYMQWCYEQVHFAYICNHPWCVSVRVSALSTTVYLHPLSLSFSILAAPAAAADGSMAATTISAAASAAAATTTTAAATSTSTTVGNATNAAASSSRSAPTICSTSTATPTAATVIAATTTIAAAAHATTTDAAATADGHELDEWTRSQQPARLHDTWRPGTLQDLEFIIMCMWNDCGEITRNSRGSKPNAPRVSLSYIVCVLKIKTFKN
jgi:hypothetical protein